MDASAVAQLVAQILAVASGAFTLLTLRRRRAASPASTPAPVTAFPTLNGYAGILRDALARLELLRDQHAAAVAEIERLRKRNEELSDRLHECEEQRTSPSPRRRRTRQTVAAAERIE